ncbi:MAG: hypothetical protein JHC33_06725 [Ignisphaera sp.]|nr:hypothetical protein [Ignisphaera sp.]
MKLTLTRTFQLVSSKECLIEATDAYEYCFGSADSDTVFTKALVPCDRFISYSGGFGAIYARQTTSLLPVTLTVAEAL